MVLHWVSCINMRTQSFLQHSWHRIGPCIDTCIHTRYIAKYSGRIVLILEGSEIVFILQRLMEHPSWNMLVPVYLTVAITLNCITYCNILHSVTMHPTSIGCNSPLTNQIIVQQFKLLLTQWIMKRPGKGEIERTTRLLLDHISEWKDNFVKPF